MNHYKKMYQPLIEGCKTPADYSKVYARISAAIAGLILGRGVNQSMDEYLADKPEKKEFYIWWMGIKDELWDKTNVKPA